MDILVNIDVDDLTKAVSFYERAAGLRVGRRFGPHGVEMLGASSPIYLLAKTEGSKASIASGDLRRYARHWTPVHLDLVVSDVEAAVGCAKDAGATLEGEIETHRWGHIAHMADPFGHGLCFVMFLNGGYDEIADKP